MGRKKPRAGEKAPKDAKVFVRLPQDLRDALERLADADDRPLAMYIRRVLTAHVEAAKKGGKR